MMPNRLGVGSSAPRRETCRLFWQIRCEESSNVKLLDHEVVELRRNIPGLMPRKIGFPDDALAGKRLFQLARVGVPIEAFAALAHDVEHLTLAVADVVDEAAPMTAGIWIEQTRVIALVVIEVPDDMHGTGLRRPDPKSRTVGNQIRTHRGTAMDVLK